MFSIWSGSNSCVEIHDETNLTEIFPRRQAKTEKATALIAYQEGEVGADLGGLLEELAELHLSGRHLEGLRNVRLSWSEIQIKMFTPYPVAQ